MGAPLRQIRKAALRHFDARALPAGPDALPAALADCAHFLMTGFGVARDDAHDIAMSAFSELSGRATGCHIDLELTTRHQVFVIDRRTGLRKCIPLIDLVRMLGPVEVARSA
jgi:hypothetical protein